MSISQRKHDRHPAEGHQIQITEVNGEVKDELAGRYFEIENISKGGFRFSSDERFELEDRVQVILFFPDSEMKEVLGRICYAVEGDTGKDAYGFSVIAGFYDL